MNTAFPLQNWDNINSLAKSFFEDSSVCKAFIMVPHEAVGGMGKV